MRTYIVLFFVFVVFILNGCIKNNPKYMNDEIISSLPAPGSDTVILPPNSELQGSVNVKSLNLKVCIYDGEEDGDQFDIYINGTMYLHNYIVTQVDTCLKVTLHHGHNWIGAKCLNAADSDTDIDITDSKSTQTFEIDANLGGPMEVWLIDAP